jgi:hypothetical protein
VVFCVVVGLSLLEHDAVSISMFPAGTPFVLVSAATLPPVYVLRSGAHSGSDWCSHLLSEAGYTTFFQFGGLCDGVPATGQPNPTPSQASDALLTTFSKGCGCGRGVFQCNACDQPRCASKMPLCNPTACTAPCPAGGSVAVVAAPLGWPGPGASDELIDAVGGTAIEALRLTFTARPNARLVTWTRTNVVKFGLSNMKRVCQCRALRNHGSKKDVAYAAEHPCFVHMPPAALLRRTVALVPSSRLLSMSSIGGVPVAHRLIYEEVQQDAAGHIDSMLRDINASSARRRRLGTTQTMKPDKLTREDLSMVLLHFGSFNAVFRPWPCLHKQLLSTRAERAELCDPRNMNIDSLSHMNASAGIAPSLMPGLQVPSGMSLSCGGSAHSANETAPPLPKQAHDTICALALGKRRKMLGAEGPADVCLLAW